MNIQKHALLFLAALSLFAFSNCEKENTMPSTPSQPEQPESPQFNLAGTTWMMVNDEWWTPQMHVIDTSIWSFITDTSGTITEHKIYNGDDPYGVGVYPMTYTFDNATMTGILYGYKNLDGSIDPLTFTYHAEDTTLTYGDNYVYHLCY